MTFENLFGGRHLLMRAQRHISQAQWDGKSPGLAPQFRTPEGEQAFFLVEALLVDLEREFDEKKKACDAKKRKRLDRCADRQVTR